MTYTDNPEIMSAHSIEDAMMHVSRGHEYSKENNLADAEICFRKALELNPDLPIAHNNLGWIFQMNGDISSAIISYRKALSLDGSLRLAQINLASLLSELGRTEEAKLVWRAIVTSHPQDRGLLSNVVRTAMRKGDLEGAAAYAEEYSALCRGSKWTRYSQENGIAIPSSPFPAPFLTVSKLKHDIAQFRYMQHCGVLESDLTEIIEKYSCVLDSIAEDGFDRIQELTNEHRSLIGHIYNRIIHIRDTPRVKNALSKEWNGSSVEDGYLDHPLGIVVVDNFLSDEALYSLREFCLQSTVWFQNRSYGRLGAFFQGDGFNCPLLIQIAEELRNAFPRVMGKHEVLQIWGFKYNSYQPETRPHADFAAVNVNFWITPNDANLEKDSGGMIIYDVEAPSEWDFDTYNKKGKIIEAYLHGKDAREIRIPYKANRAVIFNSDLFHKTEPLQFKDGYENRRINVTFLMGNRENSSGRGG